MPVTQDAHIRPCSQGGELCETNVILLRRNLQRLYDRGHASITPGYRSWVGDPLREDINNDRSYYSLYGPRVHIPAYAPRRSNQQLLDWHQTVIFKGSPAGVLRAIGI